MILNFIRWVVGGFLCIITIAGFSQGDYKLAVGVLITGILIMPWRSVAKLSNNTTKPASTSSITPSTSTANNNGVHKPSAPTSFNRISLPPLQMQALETLSLLYETKNIDTAKSRLDFLKDVMQRLDAIPKDSSYAVSLSTTIDNFKVMYYGKPIRQVYSEMILNPADTLSNFEPFKMDVLLTTFKRHYEAQQEQINSLKTTAGKQKRYSKIIDEFAQLEAELTQLHPSETLLSRISAFKEELISHRPN